MKKLLFLIVVALMMTGCVAVPVYDSGYYPYYGPYSYRYAGPEIRFFVPFVHGGYGFHGGHGSHGGRR